MTWFSSSSRMRRRRKRQTCSKYSFFVKFVKLKVKEEGGGEIKINKQAGKEKNDQSAVNIDCRDSFRPIPSWGAAKARKENIRSRFKSCCQVREERARLSLSKKWGIAMEIHLHGRGLHYGYDL